MISVISEKNDVRTVPLIQTGHLSEFGSNRFDTTTFCIYIAAKKPSYQGQHVPDPLPQVERSYEILILHPST